MVTSNQIWGFAYSRRNLGVTVLYSTEQFDYRYLIFPNNIDRYLKKIQAEKPKLIIGLGMTRPGKLFKIEKVCKNNFRQRQVDKSEEINVEIPMEGVENMGNLPQGFKFAETIGTSYCNLMSWRIQRLINKDNLNIKLLFIHIPKRSGLEALQEGLLSVIEQFNE